MEAYSIIVIGAFSSPIIKKNFFTLFYSILVIFFSIIRSLIYLIFNRPNLVFGMGGYSSFPICLAAKILKIPFIIYESNLLIGKVMYGLLNISVSLVGIVMASLMFLKTVKRGKSVW